MLLVLCITVTIPASESAPLRHDARVLVWTSSIHSISLVGFVEVLAGHGPSTHWRIVYRLQLLVLIYI